MIITHHGETPLIASLKLEWRSRVRRAEQSYLDFLIGDRFLGDLLNAGDFIGCLGWQSAEAERESVYMLLLRKPSPIVGGRVPLYICPECGQMDCGALTVSIEKTADYFVWSEFGFQTDYDAAPSFKPFRHVSPFRFDKTEYWRVLSARLS